MLRLGGRYTRVVFTPHWPDRGRTLGTEGKSGGRNDSECNCYFRAFSGVSNDEDLR